MPTKTIKIVKKVLVASNYPFILQHTEYTKGCMIVDATKATKKFPLLLNNKPVGHITLYREADYKMYGDVHFYTQVSGIGYITIRIHIPKLGSHYDEDKNRWMVTKAYVSKVEITDSNGDPQVKQINFTKLFI